MSSLATLARPYAKAAFELARGQDDLAGWDTRLENAAAVVVDERIAAWLKSPATERAKAVEVIAGDGSNEHFRRFLGVLAANDRLSLLPEIRQLFSRLREQAENRLQVRVVSAIALEADQAERMSAALSRRFEREVELRNEVDAGVLGGAVIYAGDQVIDGSLKGRLAQLQSSLA